MSDEKFKFDGKVPASATFTNAMTEAIIEMAPQYLAGYKFVLIGYKPHPEDRQLIDAAIGTNLNPREVLKTLQIMTKIVEKSMNADPQDIRIFKMDLADEG